LIGAQTGGSKHYYGVPLGHFIDMQLYVLFIICVHLFVHLSWCPAVDGVWRMQVQVTNNIQSWPKCRPFWKVDTNSTRESVQISWHLQFYAYDIRYIQLIFNYSQPFIVELHQNKIKNNIEIFESINMSRNIDVVCKWTDLNKHWLRLILNKRVKYKLINFAQNRPFKLKYPALYKPYHTIMLGLLVVHI